MEDIYYYRYLAEKYIHNQCTSEEIKELFKYFDTPASNRLLLEKMKEQFQLAMEQQHAIPVGASERIEEELMQNISSIHMATIRRKRFVLFAAAAAAILILIGGIYFLTIQESILPDKNVLASQEVKKNDVLPGGKKAILTLANGTIIVLDSVQNGILANQGGSRILKVKNGELVYNNNDRQDPDEALYNIISTPRGGKYQITLPDGSKVWLNAASSLKYPVAFHGNQRKVKLLTGEAYFEIEENKDMPFKVAVKGMEITVLGTHFNVMAYPDEMAIKTTLLEGAVKVTKNDRSVILEPGMQANLYKAKDYLNTVQIDTSMTIAWKNGDFSFNNTSIYNIMRQISRWYDVDVIYKDSLDVHLNGHISMDVKASKVFQILELTKEVNFKIDGKKIVVSK